MALPISVTYTFATATSAIPLSQLDANFTTVVNGVNGIGNGTNSLSNVSITGGNAVVTTANATTLNVSGEAAVGGNLTVTGGLVPSSSFLRNRIINGAMVIDQRNAGASVTAVDNAYTLDRWQNYSGAASKFTVQQNAGSVTPPAGFSNYLGITSSSAYTAGAGEAFTLNQNIEGYNVSDFAFGTASAKTITLSFWVRSSLTGTFSGAVRNYNASRSYPFTYTISSASTWEQKSVTIAGDTSGTWTTGNGIGLAMDFDMGSGSNFRGTAGAWNGNFNTGATGSVSVIGTNGATWYVTGVQLEVGSVATPFERRQYGQELALCQRYYVKQNDPSATSAFMPVGTGYTFNTTDATIQFNLPVTMRTRPTTVNFSNVRIFQASNGAGPALTSVLNNMGTPSVWMADVRAAGGGLTSGNIVALQGNSNTAAYAEFSAEL